MQFREARGECQGIFGRHKLRPAAAKPHFPERALFDRDRHSRHGERALNKCASLPVFSLAFEKRIHYY